MSFLPEESGCKVSTNCVNFNISVTFELNLRHICGYTEMTQQEFEQIYLSIKAQLLGLARQFCKSASVDLDAEDMVQEALIAFWDLSEKGYPITNPKALLVKITKNICISRYRKQKLKTEPIAGDYFGEDTASAITDRADERIIKQRLYDTLTRTEREYMLLKSEDGLSLDEMVRKTGKPKSSIKTTLSKFKRKQNIRRIAACVATLVVIVSIVCTHHSRTDNLNNIQTIEMLDAITALANTGMDEIVTIVAKPTKMGIVVTAEYRNGETAKFLMKKDSNGCSVEMTAMN